MKKIIFLIILVVLISCCVGGCFGGTHMINNLVVEPEISCLIVDTNNCNEGMLWVTNNCKEPVTIGNLKIEEGYSYIDASRTSSGEIVVNFVNSNYSFYRPSFNDHITINGTVGNAAIKISYVKTKR